ncbi:MAG: thioredoxin fold domain-containing protein [Prochlorococcus sp.]|nr:thioredoxin fold domain-containing protein [Prochlorococcus sp.]
MTGSPQASSLNNTQRLMLLLAALILAIVLFVLRGGLNAEAPLDQLARRSLEPDIALANGRPTVIEFYADWCEACRKMAPDMLATEQKTNNKIDIVLVNIDNPRWEELVDRYGVNGIPQLNFFDAEGNPKGESRGVRSPEQLEQLTNALIENQPLPQFAGMGTISNLPDTTLKANNSEPVGPRDHG